ncbi:hypothetical protein R3P38DRAFT_3212028 [Favolaschia claudopus]|uniref:NGN domain-containing protein n=1 Tax=Favolaschia claudopus TaxID=2862362 RepID=A0AAW0AE78_9AGAR
MSKAMKKYRALDFLDLAAVDDSDSEEEHELNDVFTRAAYIDDDEDTSSNEVRPPRFVADSSFSIDPEQAAREIEERYRARYSADSEARIGDTEIGRSIFEWAHTMERIEGSPKVPVWMIKVARGRELDVVGTILKICSIHTGENVLSATAPPSAPGIVYIECDHEAIVRNLQRKVAFIRRDILPRQVTSTDFRSALVLRPVHDIEESAWVRIRRNNGYLGDLGWVQTRIEDTPWYVVYVVPRMEVREGESGGKISGGDNDEEERSASEAQPENEQLRGGSVLPFGKKRKWASISQPLDWQPTFFVDHVSGKLDPSNVHESSSGATFHYGFLVLSLPQEDLTWHNVVPSFEEAQLWGSSPFFLAAEHTPGGFDNRDEPLVLQFAASVAKAVETTNTRGELRVGDQVRIIADDNLSVGTVLDVGAGELVRVQLYDPDAPTIEVDVPASQLVLHHRVGDFVQVVIGRLTGMLGWITAVDWPQRQVDVMYHASVTSEPLPSERLGNEEPQIKDREGDGNAVLNAEAGKVPGESKPGDASDDQPSSSLQRPPAPKPRPPLRGLKPPHLMTAYEPDDPAASNPHYVLPWSHIRRRNETSAHRDIGVLDAEAHKISVPRASQDPYQHVEVKAFSKNIGVIFGSVTTTSPDGNFVWVKTEGRAINTIEKVPVANVVERHTSLTLSDYRAAPPDEIRALRIQQESARAAGPPNTASTNEFSSESLPLAQEAWPEVLADQSSSSTLASSSSSTPAPPVPSTIEPGRWLLHPNLRGKHLDVIIHGATGPRSADCNDKVGVIQALPDEIKRGIKGSVKVRFGLVLATDRFIPIVNIFPLTTNEFEGCTTRDEARCILDLINVFVVVIGPDVTGDMSPIGQSGYTTYGRKIRTIGPKVSSIYRIIDISDTGAREDEYEEKYGTVPSPHFDSFEDEDFIDSPFPSRFAASLDSSPVSVRNEGGALDIARVQAHRLRFGDHFRSPYEPVKELWTQRDRARLSVSAPSSYASTSSLGSLRETAAASPWPFPTSMHALTSPSPFCSVVPPRILVPNTPSPDWLLQRALHGCCLDVVISGASASASRPYNDRIGVIRSLPAIKRGQRGSVLVRFGRDICTDKWIPVKNVFPLLTTEFDGVISRARSKSIFDIPGVSVVIIGGDADGAQEYIGRTGIMTSYGMVDLQDSLVSFPIGSTIEGACKSLFEMDSDLSLFGQSFVVPPAAPPSSPALSLTTYDAQYKNPDNVACPTGTAFSTALPFASASAIQTLGSEERSGTEEHVKERGREDNIVGTSGEDFDQVVPADLFSHYSAFRDSLNERAEILDKIAENLWGAYASLSRFAKHVPTAEPSEVLANAAIHLLGDMEEYGVPTEDMTAKSAHTVDGAVHCEVHLAPGVHQHKFTLLTTNPAQLDRFTDELRKQIVSAFKDGDIDLETFKARLYAPIVLPPEDIGVVQTSLPIAGSDMDDEGDYNYAECVSIGDGDLEKLPEDFVAVDDKSFIVDAQSTRGDEPMELQYFDSDSVWCNNEGEDREASIVYLEDIQPRENEPSRRLKGSSAPQKKNSRVGQERKITSFFARQPRRKLKVALNRHLRKAARPAPLTGPGGASIASETNYNPRVHRPEVLGFAPNHLPRVQRGGRYSTGERAARAHSLRVEDVHIGEIKSAPLVAPLNIIATVKTHKDVISLDSTTPRFCDYFGNAWSFADRALYPVPHLASHVEEYASDLMQRKGYLKKVDCVLYATDERVPIVVPVPFNIGADLDDATIDDLFVHAYVAYAGLANIVDMSKGRRTVITHNFAPLDYPYTIFYTPPGVAEPKNMSLATNRGRIPWKGNVLVVKHHAYPETPMDVTREEVTRITIMVRRLERLPYFLPSCSLNVAIGN